MTGSPAPGGFRLVVFDCDGTLVDSAHTIVAAMQESFRLGGRDRPEAEAVRRQIGLSLEYAIANLLAGVIDAEVLRLAESYRGIVRAWREVEGIAEPLFPGIRAAIAALTRPERFLGIATGKNRRGLDHTLAAHGLSGYFHTLQTGDCALSKPDPDMVLRALAETGCTAAETVVVGDTSFDMAMARAAGARAIGVAWGYHERGELLAAGAELVLEQAADLPPALSRLSGAPE